MADVFHVSFDTLDTPSLVKAVRVEIGTEFLRDADVANIALASHPLYPKLAQYVFDNPPAGVVVRRRKA